MTCSERAAAAGSAAVSSPAAAAAAASCGELAGDRPRVVERETVELGIDEVELQEREVVGELAGGRDGARERAQRLERSPHAATVRARRAAAKTAATSSRPCAASASSSPRLEPKRWTIVAGDRPHSAPTAASVSARGAEPADDARGGRQDVGVGDRAWARHVAG